jgi:L-iditol 2-dehydrogenase
MPVPVIQNNELWVTGIFRYNNTWPVAIDLVASGKVDLDSMVTGEFPLAETAQALDSTATPGVIKSVVQPHK